MFSGHYTFGSLEEAREHLHRRLMKMNENSRMEEEKLGLSPRKPPLELADISEHTVNNQGMVCVNTCFYSVPEYLVGKRVIVKKYHDEIRI